VLSGGGGSSLVSQPSELIEGCGALHHGMPSSPRDQPLVYWKRCRPGDKQREDETSPEEPRPESGVHCARYEEHDRVVYDFHDGDGDCV
jgi:hypothetical protein